MPENPTSMPEPSGENTAEVVAGKNDSNVPETPAEPLGGFVYPGDDDLAGIPVPPIASPGGRPVYPEMTISLESRRHRSRRLADAPSIPTIRSGTRAFRRFLFRSHTRRSQEGITTAESGFKCQHIRPYFGCLYRWPEYLLGSEFATISSYIRVTDGFHTVTVRRTNGQIYYQQTIAFVSGERLTMVILDTVSRCP